MAQSESEGMPEDVSYIRRCLPRLDFMCEVYKWSPDEQHSLRVVFERIPSATHAMLAVEFAFKAFAIQRGLLKKEFFYEDGHEIPLNVAREFQVVTRDVLAFERAQLNIVPLHVAFAQLEAREKRRERLRRFLPFLPRRVNPFTLSKPMPPPR